MPFHRNVAANDPFDGSPATGVSAGAPTAAKCADVRFSADAVITPTFFPFSVLISNNADVATGTGESCSNSF